MVGLSIVLETTDNTLTLSECKITPKPHQVVNKSAVKIRAAVTETACLRRGLDSGFLEHCFLCKGKLLPAKDIYMYQGDRAFCSVDCRSKQMITDEEESLRRESYCSFVAVKTKVFDSPVTSSTCHRRDPRAGKLN